MGDRVRLASGVWTVHQAPERARPWELATVLVVQGGSYQRVDAGTPGGVELVGKEGVAT